MTAEINELRTNHAAIYWKRISGGKHSKWSGTQTKECAWQVQKCQGASVAKVEQWALVSVRSHGQVT